ncbi:hypothetical protein, partial [Enterobacter hormaechei]
FGGYFFVRHFVFLGILFVLLMMMGVKIMPKCPHRLHVAVVWDKMFNVVLDHFACGRNKVR